MKYSAGHNIPGYLPEGEPGEYDTWDEARQHILDELEHARGFARTGTEDDGICAAILEVESLPEGALGTVANDPHGYSYWIEAE